MKTAVINFKVDSEIKRQAQELAQELGVPLSTVVNAQLKQFLRSRSFSVDDSPVMSDELEDILHQIERDRKTGRNFSPTFTSVDDIFQHINKSS